MNDKSDKHAPSRLPAGKNWELVWNDEFDGTELDTTKWEFRYNILQQKQKHLTGPEGISLDGNGNLVMKLLKKGDDYFTSQLQTGYAFTDETPTKSNYSKVWSWPIGKFHEHKFLHKYGYYECRCKLQKQPGWWSAFWLQSPMIGACNDPRKAGVEVDIMECFDVNPTLYMHNNHWNGYGEDHKTIGSNRKPLDNPDDYHYFGLEWTPEEYIYYVDGKESWRVKEPVGQTECFILLSCEVKGYRSSGLPYMEQLRNAKLPDAFVVDFVRVYDEVK